MKSRVTFSRLKIVAGVSRRAFSLIEILVVTGLLSVIILGLVLMFTQTQRAYKLGTTQVDVLEGGRMVTDLMTRDLSQLTAANAFNAINFYVGLRNYSLLEQALPGSGAVRENLLQEVFFLTHENQKWTAVGYFVRTNDNFSRLDFPAGTSGALYRFETNYNETVFRQNPDRPWQDFNAALTNANRVSRILDGVVHFKVRGYDPSGYWVTTNTGLNIYTNLPASPVAQYPFGETPFLFFQSNAVPATVEVELGVLESREIERARSISDATARANFLAQQAGKVHIFRWRVPVRNFDPVAYQ